MCQNVIQLNKDKTELIVFGPKDKRLKVSAQLQSLITKLRTTTQAINLDDVMDLDLYLNRIWRNVSMHLPSVDLTNVTVCSQVSVKSQSECCSSIPH